MNNLDSFKKAFDPGGCSCQGTCNCGRIFYNDDENGWDREDGELERLRADKNATAVDYAVSMVIFEGREYAMNCNCWRARAKRIIEFIDSHAESIAKYLTIEKKRKQFEANRAPVVGDTPPAGGDG